MDAALKAKWIAALRSGEYQQARGILRAGDKFCCLGVALDAWGGTWEGDECGWKGQRLWLRANYAEIADIIDGLSPAKARTLVEMNDGLGGREQHSFSEIADFIEQHIPTSDHQSGASENTSG